MKKLITLIALAVLTVSCDQTIKAELAEPKPTLKNTTELSNAKSIECITGYLSNGTFTQSGLYKVTLQDGREILIYQKSEGVTMLQLK
jgi:PBP1b-binding outer membrane lipoprotein LpoB